MVTNCTWHTYILAYRGVEPESESELGKHLIPTPFQYVCCGVWLRGVAGLDF